MVWTTINWLSNQTIRTELLDSGASGCGDATVVGSNHHEEAASLAGTARQGYTEPRAEESKSAGFCLFFF